MKRVLSLASADGGFARPLFHVKALMLENTRNATEAILNGDRILDPAIRIAQWASIMTQWQWRIGSEIRKRRPIEPGVRTPTRWQIMGFHRSARKQPAGIVNLMAIRKHHTTADGNFDGGNLFEIILIQIKTGDAQWSNVENIRKLRAAAKDYSARDVVLAEWVKGSQQRFYRLQKEAADPKGAWEEVDPRVLFC